MALRSFIRGSSHKSFLSDTKILPIPLNDNLQIQINQKEFRIKIFRHFSQSRCLNVNQVIKLESAYSRKVFKIYNQERVLKCRFSTSTFQYSLEETKANNRHLPPQRQELRPTITSLQNFVSPYLQLARVDKPIGTMLLLWPCVWSIGMASFHLGSPPLDAIYTLGLFSSGAFIMRGAGCTINDLWDSEFDKKVERTRLRPLAAGILSKKQAIGFLAVQLSAGLTILTQLNNYSIVLGAASLSLVIVYPLMKRITYWPQLVLGLAFNWGALLGWSAMAGSLDLKVALPLYLAGVNWTLVYDTIYAHQDKTDDTKIGVKSTALFMASDTKKYLTGFSLATIGLLCTSGFYNDQGLPFYLATIVGGGGHLAWQLNTVDYNCTKSCWQKFKSNQQFGAIVAFGIYADYLIACI